MNWFYNSEVFKTQKVKTKNNIGQIIETYIKTNSVKADVQPAGNNLVEKIFGENIVCNYLVYCDEKINTNDIVIYKNEAYRVNKIAQWDDYTIAAIEGVDIIVS